MKKLTKEELIKNYSDKDVNHVEPLEHIFLKPSMYLGSVETPQHTIEEAVMNSVDEAKIGVAENIWITLHKDHSITVTDDGRGVPVAYSSKFKMPTLRALFTLPNTGKGLANFTEGSSVHGIGMKAVVATSTFFKVVSYRDGKVYHDEYQFKDGQPGCYVTKLTTKKELPSRKQKEGDLSHGTSVTWLPNDLVFDSLKINWKTLTELAHNLTYLNPGLTVTVTDEKKNRTETFTEEGGLEDLLKKVVEDNGNKMITPIYRFSSTYDTGEIKNNAPLVLKADILFAWTNSNSKDSVLFTNNVTNPLLGTPITGSHKGIVRLINKYAKSLNMTKNTLVSRDILPGLTLLVNLTHPNPQFNGQAKKEITSTNADNGLNVMVYNDAQLPIDRNIQPITEVIKLVLKRESERKKSEQEKFNLNDKGSKLVVNKKLSDCQTKGAGKGSEIFIVEGDSAGGSVETERDVKTQALIAIRGKILNVQKATTAKAMANEEINAIFGAIGCGINQDFNIEKRNYDKIIIATDQDSDGAAISCLILTAILKFAPELIRQGFVYRVLTPLFVNHFRDGSVHYTYSQKEQNEFVKKTRKKVIKTERNKGLGELHTHEVERTIINHETRKLIQFQIDDKNEEDCYDIVEKMMGKKTEERQRIFYDPNLYNND